MDQGIEASVDGVLGGFGCLNEIDVEGSDGFLETLLPKRFGAEKRHLVALGIFLATSIIVFSWMPSCNFMLFNLILVIVNTSVASFNKKNLKPFSVDDCNSKIAVQALEE